MKRLTPVVSIIIGISALFLSAVPYIILSTKTCNSWGCGLGEFFISAPIFIFGVIFLIVGIKDAIKNSFASRGKADKQVEPAKTNSLSSATWWFFTVMSGIILIISSYFAIAFLFSWYFSAVPSLLVAIVSLIIFSSLINSRHRKKVSSNSVTDTFSPSNTAPQPPASSKPNVAAQTLEKPNGSEDYAVYGIAILLGIAEILFGSGSISSRLLAASYGGTDTLLFAFGFIFLIIGIFQSIYAGIILFKHSKKPTLPNPVWRVTIFRALIIVPPLIFFIILMLSVS